MRPLQHVPFSGIDAANPLSRLHMTKDYTLRACEARQEQQCASCFDQIVRIVRNIRRRRVQTNVQTAAWSSQHMPCALIQEASRAAAAGAGGPEPRTLKRSHGAVDVDSLCVLRTAVPVACMHRLRLFTVSLL